MSLSFGLMRQLRVALAPVPVEGCGPCRHFCTDPGRLEAEIPGLATLSSAHAAVRANDGLCLAYSRLINGRKRCGAFAPRQVGICDRLPA